MTRRIFVLLALLAVCATNVRADDPPAPAPRHENKISPEAKAAMEKFRSLVYRPGDHGLKSMKGEIVAVDFPSRARTAIEFSPSGGLKTWVPPGFGDEVGRLKIDGSVIDYWVDMAHDPADIFADSECDADVVERDGKRVLLLNGYRDGVPRQDSEYELDVAGLVVRRTRHGRPGDKVGDYVQTYVWSNVDDAHCITATEVAWGSGSGARTLCAYRYTEGTGVHVVSSYDLTQSTKDVAPRTFTFCLDDLVVNGKKAELPTPWKHVNKVSPEAKAAIDRYTRLVDRPAEHGIASLTATIVEIGVAVPKMRRLKFEAPGHADVDTAKGVDPKSAQGRLGRVMLGLPFEASLAGVPVADGDEYDADLAERSGSRVLVVTNFKDGARRGTGEFSFDDAGLLTSASQDMGGTTGSPAGTVKLTWGTCGDRHRIDTIDWSAGTASDSLCLHYTLTYSEVAGASLPTSFTMIVTGAVDGQTLNQRGAFRLDDVVVNGTKVDAPKPRAHGNKVSQEARAAIDAYAKLVYRAADHGLRSATGTLLPGGIRLAITPDSVALQPLDDAPGSSSAALAESLRPLLRMSLAGVPLVESDEYDAEFIEEQGRSVLVVTTFLGSLATQRSESFLDERGLVVSMRAMGIGPSAAESDFKFIWTQVGSQWQVERVETWVPTKPMHMTVALTFVEVAGIRVPVSMKWMSSNVQGVTRPVVLAVDDLVVNGAKVALPKVVLHENEVSPEAQALLDAYARRVHRPSEHGLVTASGAVVPDGVKAPLRRAFSYSAPLFLKVTLPPEGKPDAASGRAVIASTTFALLLGLDGLRLTESLEYDARVVENADARTLEITNYGAGARTGMSEITFDGAGLVASLRRKDGPDAAAPTSDVEFRFVWEKSGTGNRVRSAELISGPADKQARKRYTLTYSTINGVDVVTSYIVTVLEAGSPEKVFSYRIEDLVVNGKKVDPPPAAGTPK